MPGAAPDEQDARIATALDAARRAVAAGTPFDLPLHAAELDRALAALYAATGGHPGASPEADSAAGRARSALSRIASLARARARLSEPASYGPPAGAPAGTVTEAPTAPAPAAPRPAAASALLAAKVTISGNLLVEKSVIGSELVLAWKLPPAAQQVLVQIEQRPTPRDEWAQVAQHELGAVTSFTLALDDVPKRLLLRVEGRGGRVLGRARIAGLTAATAAGKWQRQATAA